MLIIYLVFVSCSDGNFGFGLRSIYEFLGIFDRNIGSKVIDCFGIMVNFEICVSLVLVLMVYVVFFELCI